MKGTLTLRRQDMALDNEQLTDVVIGVYDALLPGRNYKIEHKVAEVGKVSQSTEFLLRLINSVDGMPETEVAKFFDFSPLEMTYLLNDALSLGYISRDSGRLWTTSAGRDLFVPGGEEPQIFNVEKRTWTFGFDLISFAPQDSVRTTAFDHCLHSLDVDQTLISKGREQIPASFKRHFTELNTKQGTRALLKRSLYSIDSVTPGDKFSALVPVVVKAPQSSLTQGEPALFEWRPEHELDDRPEVVTAIGKFVEELRLHVPESAVDDYKLLIELAPEFIRNYTLKNGFAVERYQRDAAAVKDHKFQKRRKTIAIIGPFFTPINSSVLDLAVTRAIGYTPGTYLSKRFYWRAPRRPYWGATRALPSIVQRVQDQIAEKLGSDEQKPSAVLLLERNMPTTPHKAFTEKQYYNNGGPPQSVEIFLVPGVATGVLIHLPGSSTYGHAVPIGFISIDPLVVSRTEEYLKQYGEIDVPLERVSAEDIDLMED